MSCLTHDKRFRSTFHSIINQLRNENRTPVSVLRTMPRMCCTCTDENKDTIESVMIKNDHQIMKLKELIERIEREKQINNKLILSFNRFVQLIEQNRTATAVVSQPETISNREKLNSTAADSEDDSRMDTSRPRSRHKKVQKTAKQIKPIKSGTFIFLPYKPNGTDSKESADIYLNMARTLQRKRFLAPNGPIPLIEKQHGVRINMITKKTNDFVKQALENAKNNLDKLTIHDKDRVLASSQTQSGEWVLVRTKKVPKRSTDVDIDKAIDQLMSRWENSFTLGKRGIDDDDDEESSNHSAKKSKGKTEDASDDSSSSSSSDSESVSSDDLRVN